MPIWKRTETPPAPPPIGPPPPGGRPFWSVMVPTYEPSGLLEQTLRAVLDQDPGPEAMQVAVVDDRSPGVDVGALLRRIDPDGRVELHRGEANLGLAGNWNRAVALARGRWVHLLHQDDLIGPGFYEAMGRAARERPDAGAAFCRHRYIDGLGQDRPYCAPDGRRLPMSVLERPEAGVIDDWLDRIAVHQRVECASIVVCRDVYERVGGFRPDLRYVVDWEMWVRVAAHAPVWYEPRPLACYRQHEESETSRLKRGVMMGGDFFRATEIFAPYLPADRRDRLVAAARRTLLPALRHDAIAMMQAGRVGEGMGLFRAVCRCDPSLRFGRQWRGFQIWALKQRLRSAASLGRRAGA